MNKKQLASRFAALRASYKRQAEERALGDSICKEIVEATRPCRELDMVRVTDTEGKSRKAMVCWVMFGYTRSRPFRKDSPWSIGVRYYRGRKLGKTRHSIQASANFKIEVLDEPHPEEVKDAFRRQRRFVSSSAPRFPDEPEPPKGYVWLGLGPLKVQPSPMGLDPKSESRNLVMWGRSRESPSWEKGACGDSPDAFYAAKKGSKIAKENLGR